MQRLLCALLLASLMVPAASAQTDAYAFSIARIQYSGGGDWYSDPQSLPELLKYVRAQTSIDVAPRAETVELSSVDVFSYPYLYMTGHGNVVLSTQEALRLRRYLLGGGFLHVDDNYGLDRAFRRELRKVFPDRELVELPFDHPIYHSVFDFPAGLPKVHEHDGNPPQGFAILDDNDRVVLFYSFESDLGDGWEPQSVHDNPAALRDLALRAGANILAYALMY